MVDTKLTKGPPVWDGDRRRWRHWSVKVEGYVATLNPQMPKMMEIAGQQKEPIKHDGLQDEHVKLSGNLYGLLNALTELDVYETLFNCEKGTGLEVWRRFSRNDTPHSPRTTRSRLMWLVKPDGLTGRGKTA